MESPNNHSNWCRLLHFLLPMNRNLNCGQNIATYCMEKTLMLIWPGTLLDSSILATATVSPKRQYRGIFCPTTPATQGPEWIPIRIWREQSKPWRNPTWLTLLATYHHGRIDDLRVYSGIFTEESTGRETCLSFSTGGDLAIRNCLLGDKHPTWLPFLPTYHHGSPSIDIVFWQKRRARSVVRSEQCEACVSF